MIRNAVPADSPAISGLIGSLAHCFIDSTDTSLPGWIAESTRPSVLAARIDDHSFRHYVYLDEGEIIGYIAIKDGRHLYYLFVDKEHQGQGIARQLWDHACREIRSETYVVRSSLFAVPVYERFGFTISGPVSVRDGIAFQPMELKVDSL